MDNAATMHGLYDLINTGDIDGFVDRLAEDFVEHEVMPGQDPTRAGTKELFTAMKAGFPDLRFNAEDIMSIGDRVVARARVTGTNTGEFMGMPETGKGIDAPVIEILRFGEDGLVHEHWGIMDMMTIMQQLGAVPQGLPG
jgi:steroid delta-isomerase-like uncharacterized protein